MAIDMTGWVMKEHNVPDDYLTVLGKTNKRTSRGEVIWYCQCECGNTTELSGTDVRRGKTKSCGCKQYELQQKSAGHYLESGTRFGRLTVIRLLPYNEKGVFKYECQCDYGRQIFSIMRVI